VDFATLGEMKKTGKSINELKKIGEKIAAIK
jgi:hypothetical protein